MVSVMVTLKRSDGSGSGCAADIQLSAGAPREKSPLRFSVMMTVDDDEGMRGREITCAFWFRSLVASDLLGSPFHARADPPRKDGYLGSVLSAVTR